METILARRPQSNFEFERKDENQIVMKIEALKNLASLLLKHLESLEKTSVPYTNKAGLKANLFD
jgi:hypothetical protein